MSFRSANIGLLVATALMAVGLLCVGRGASDAELQLICWPALAVGFVVMLVLDARHYCEADEVDRSPARGE